MTAFVISNAGGNWNAAASYVANSGFPAAGDTVTATGTSGNLTVNVNSACASVDFTNYVGTFTINNAVALTVTSTFKMVSGMNVGGPGTLTCNGASTLTSGGKQPAWAVTLQGAVTYTLGDAWVITGTLTCGNAANALTINSNSFTAAILNCGTSGIVSGTAKLIVGGTAWNNTGNGTYQNSVDINSAGSVTFGSNLKYNTGTLTWVASSVINGTLTVTGSCTLSLGSNAGARPQNLTVSLAATITLGAELWVTSATTLPNANVTFTGAFDIHCMSSLTNSAGSSRTYSFPNGQTLHIGDVSTGGALQIQSNSQSGHHIFNSDSAGVKAKLKVWSGSIQSCIYTNFTDIDATPGESVFNFGGNVVTSFNVFNTYPPTTTSNNAQAIPVMRYIRG